MVAIAVAAVEGWGRSLDVVAVVGRRVGRLAADVEVVERIVAVEPGHTAGKWALVAAVAEGELAPAVVAVGVER